VPKTRSRKNLRKLHGAVVDLVVQMNLPQRDDTLLREAGLSLDRALFPLLVGIERYGPIGVVDLAQRTGRDHTTVSRQVAKLGQLGLIERQPGAVDRRVNEAVLSARGRTMTQTLDKARRRIAAPILAKWSDEDFELLAHLLRRYVDDLMALPGPRDTRA